MEQILFSFRGITIHKAAIELINPLRVFITIFIAIFCVEAGIMFSLIESLELNVYQTAFIDASLLVIVLHPILYFLLLKPLKAHLSEYNKLEQMIFEIEEREQKLIGENLHDSLGQILTGIAFKTKSIENKLKENLHVTFEEVSQITSLINQATKESKNLAKQLLSFGTGEESLLIVLNKLASDTEKIYGISCSFKSDEYLQLFNRITVTHLYRIAQESVTNAIKHGKPNAIEISLTRQNHQIELKIRDDGKGMPEILPSTKGLGLQIIKHRAFSIGAEIDIQSKMNHGTTILCTLIDKKKTLISSII